MTVQVSEGLIVLSGDCGVENAEALLAALLDNPAFAVEIEAETLHTALWQVLLAVRPAIRGGPRNSFAGRHILPLIETKDPARLPEETRSTR